MPAGHRQHVKAGMGEANLHGVASPPGEIDVWRRADPIVHFLWETKVFHVAVAEEHVFVSSAFVVVPDRPIIR